MTPGPNNVLLTAVGGSLGIRQGLPLWLRITSGFMVMIFAVAFGVVRTALAFDHASSVARVAGTRKSALSEGYGARVDGHVEET